MAIISQTHFMFEQFLHQKSWCGGQRTNGMINPLESSKIVSKLSGVFYKVSENAQTKRLIANNF